MATSRRKTVAQNKIANTELETVTIGEFCKANGFVQVHNEVRENVNGYPYLTFINRENIAENVYFSKKESENHEAGDPVSVADGFFNDLRIAYTINEAGEERVKICGPGESTREDLSGLL